MPPQLPVAKQITDVDHFKRVNDDFRHQFGDQVLRILTQTLRLSTREADFVAHLGNGELVVLSRYNDTQKIISERVCLLRPCLFAHVTSKSEIKVNGIILSIDTREKPKPEENS